MLEKAKEKSTHATYDLKKIDSKKKIKQNITGYKIFWLKANVLNIRQMGEIETYVDLDQVTETQYKPLCIEIIVTHAAKWTDLIFRTVHPSRCRAPSAIIYPHMSLQKVAPT